MGKRDDYKSSKKAQVTIFVIIAIIVIAAGVGYAVLRNNTLNPPVKPEFSAINSEITYCNNKT